MKNEAEKRGKDSRSEDGSGSWNGTWMGRGHVRRSLCPSRLRRWLSQRTGGHCGWHVRSGSGGRRPRGRDGSRPWEASERLMAHAGQAGARGSGRVEEAQSRQERAGGRARMPSRRALTPFSRPLRVRARHRLPPGFSRTPLAPPPKLKSLLQRPGFGRACQLYAVHTAYQIWILGNALRE